ncbi:hypothetical protein DFH06DRAFT_1291425 [Mycena polygramma]|nr:hypothetical protein DFH06DRAFT_1291425 [Mycena polygramma]
MARGNSGRSHLERPFKRWLTSGSAFFSWSQPPPTKKFSLQTIMPSLNLHKLVHGLAIGVFYVCVVVVPWVKEGHTSFAASLAALLLTFTTVNIGVLNVVVLSPRLRQAESKQVIIINLAIGFAALVAALRHALLPALVLVNVGVLNLVVVSFPRLRQSKQVSDHVHGPGTLVLYDGFPRRSQEDLFVNIVLVLAGQIQLLIQATTFRPVALALLDTEHSAVEPAQFVPGMDDGKASLLQVIFVFLAVLVIDSAMILSNVVLCVLLALASAYSNAQDLVLGILIRHQSWCSSTDPHGDDANATLVDDTRNPDKDIQPVRADTLCSLSPPPSLAQPSALRADAPDFILSSANVALALDPVPLTVNEDAAPSEPTTVAPEPHLDSSAPAFIPFRRPTSAPLAPNVVLPSVEDAKKKKEWQPARALSFQWARGGCPIRITAPAAPTLLDGSAPQFVLKPRAATAPLIPIVDEDARRPNLTAGVEVKTENTKKDWQPTRALSFQWARGGCPTRITAPPIPLNGSAPQFVLKPRAVSAPVIPIVDEDAYHAKKDWQPTRALSFQWSRGGYPTRITAPAASTPLNVSAPEFVPPPRVAPPLIPIVDEDAHRRGLSESMWATCATPAAEIKTERVFRRAPPSFWTRGRCAIPIVPPTAA